MDTDLLHKSYDQVVPRASRLKDALCFELGHLLAKHGITLGVPLEARVKEWSSIEEKISRKALELGQITDLDDLVGLRVILLFRRDLIAVDRLLRDELVVRSAEDTALRLTEAQFGYQSQHYVIELPPTWLKLPSYRDFGGIRAEIQVRTLAQHIWAAASHKLQYKHEASVPVPLRRSIHRASALLETVDLEFERLLEERNAYVQVQLEHAQPNESLNVELLRSVLTEVLPAENKGTEEPYDDLLVDLNHFKVDTSEKLRGLLARHMKAILATDALTASRQGKEHFFTHVGLAREGLREEFGQDAVNAFMFERRRRRASPAGKPPGRKRASTKRAKT